MYDSYVDVVFVVSAGAVDDGDAVDGACAVGDGYAVAAGVQCCGC